VLLQANALHIPLADESVHCVVTSPPYWGLRDYGTAEWSGGDAGCDHKGDLSRDRSAEFGSSNTSWGIRDGRPTKCCPKCGARRIDSQIGLEPTYQEHVKVIADVFDEVRRVLRKDGTLWLNYGDSYVSAPPGNTKVTPARTGSDGAYTRLMARQLGHGENAEAIYAKSKGGLKAKNLVGMPWRVAFALQERGWYLRQDIIWAKPNPMPESVTDRPTKSHEYLFLLTKSARYYYDQEAVREPHSQAEKDGIAPISYSETSMEQTEREGRPGFRDSIGVANRPRGYYGNVNGRNIRSVWNIATEPYSGAHFATFPQALVTPCVLAGTSAKGCCPTCGKGWVRNTETSRTFESGSGKAGHLPSGKNGPNLQGGGETLDIRRGPVLHTKTLGWSPSCSCPSSDPVPCVVLDPFCGSGTVGKVCDATNRRFVGLDLSMEYLKLAQVRVEMKASDVKVDGLPLFAER